MNKSNRFTSLDEYKEYLDIVAESNKKVGDASARLLRSDKNIELLYETGSNCVVRRQKQF